MGKRRYTSREAFTSILRDLTRTLEVVGHEPAQRLAWLMSFIARPLSDASSRDAAATELNGFLCYHVQAWAGNVNTAVQLEALRGDTAVDILTVQTDMRALLQALAPDAGLVRLPQPIGDALAWGSKGVYLVSERSLRSQTSLAIVDLLRTIGPRLRRCEGCSTLFAQGRSHQKYCTERCSDKYRVMRHRHRKRDELLEQKHQRYVKKVRARTYPGARVARRKQRSTR